jgi:hypothetical protein
VAADWTIPDTELKVVLAFSYAVRQEYVGWVGTDLLSFLVCALLEVNDQLQTPNRYTTIG